MNIERPKSRNPPSDLIRDSMHLRMYISRFVYAAFPRSFDIGSLKWIPGPLYRTRNGSMTGIPAITVLSSRIAYLIRTKSLVWMNRELYVSTIYIYAARSVKFNVRARFGGIFLYLRTHSLSKLSIGLLCLRVYATMCDSCLHLFLLLLSNMYFTSWIL